MWCLVMLGCAIPYNLFVHYVLLYSSLIFYFTLGADILLFWSEFSRFTSSVF